jgi:molybdopterin-synthase adenylyltransferase
MRNEANLNEAGVVTAARYARQLQVPGWGVAGQRRLAGSVVLVAGVGGLGCPVTQYLAAAGVGELRIWDADTVEHSNLNRQIHYTEADVGQRKAHLAAARLSAQNPAVRVQAHAQLLGPDTMDEAAAGADLLVDCLDNFEGRYLLNQYSVDHAVPLVHGAVWGLAGQLALLDPPHTACLRCVFPEAPPAIAIPVVGAGAGLIACTQALLALKTLVGLATPERGKLLLYDSDPISLRTIVLRRAEGCPACGTSETNTGGAL